MTTMNTVGANQGVNNFTKSAEMGQEADKVGADQGVNNFTKSAEMGKEDFLKMLIVQLENQDPLNPMEGTDFTAQIAQFSSLEQLTNLNGRMDSVSSRLAAIDNLGTASLIGKSVLTEGNSIIADGGKVDLVYQLEDYIQEGVLEIYRSDGAVMDVIELGSRSPGEYKDTWDSGDVPEGNYAFRLTAENDEGGYASWTPMMTGLVTGVTFKDDTAYLSVNGDEIPVNDVTVIKETTAGK
jgi:flagellar basal-body rod modification protein FlgD